LRTIRSKWKGARALWIAAALVAIGGGTWRAWGQANRPAAAPYEVEVVSLFRHGFEPAEISRPAGPFLLVIRSYDHDSDHGFDAASGDQGVLPAAMNKDQFRWTGLVSLGAGDHVLQDHDRAERHLKITIRQ
jgi:hypothetical protein